MQRMVQMRLWLAAGLLLAAASGAAAGGPYALLIASAEVRPSSPRDSYHRLDSPPNDVQLIASLLTLRFGFRPQDIRVVGLPAGSIGPGFSYAAEESDRANGWQATYGRTEEGFDWLRQHSQERDYVTVYYSGHGASVTDKDGDEPDGLDEALVPYDGTLIVDDEIGAWLARIKARQITVIVDACYSGTISRAAGASGREKVFASDRPAKRRRAGESTQRGVQDSRVVLLTASRADGSATEEVVVAPDRSNRLYISAFTWDLYQELLWAQAPGASCRALMGSVTRRLRGRGCRQEPDLVLPQGKSDAFAIAPAPGRTRRPYLPLVSKGPDGLELPAGRLAGVMEGDQFAGEGRGRPLLQVASAGWFSSRVRAIRGKARPRLGVTPRRPFLRLAGALLRIVTGRKGALPPDLLSGLSDVVVAGEPEGSADLHLRTDEVTGRLEAVEPDERRVLLGDVRSPQGRRTLAEYLSSYRLRRQLRFMVSSVHPLGLSLTLVTGDGPATSASGPAVRLASGAGGYLLLFHVDPAGRVRALWPGVGPGKGAMRARREYTAGTPGFPSPFQEHGLTGTHDLVAILCSRPIVSEALGGMLSDTGPSGGPAWRAVKPGSEEGVLDWLTDLLSAGAGRADSPDLDVASLSVTVEQDPRAAPLTPGEAALDSILR